MAVGKETCRRQDRVRVLDLRRADQVYRPRFLTSGNSPFRCRRRLPGVSRGVLSPATPLLSHTAVLE